jgi:hypothetical protein
MADTLYLTAPEYIVKFPEIDVPGTHKVEDFSGYVPVMSFSEADRQNKGGVGSYTDGNQAQQECVPVMIQTDPIIRGLLIKLIGKGFLDKEIKMIQLGRDDDSGQTERYEAELEGIWLESLGPSGLMVRYQKYESSRYRKDDSTIKAKFDFIKQKAED